MSSDAQRVIVTGAGVGGLVAAIDLARAGFEVHVFEAAGRPGGKVRQTQLAGRFVDVGPTVLTMRWVLDELFADAGWSLEREVPMRRAESVARHTWQDGATLELFADRERSADAIGNLAGARAAKRYRDFCEYARRIYDTVEGPFLRSGRPSPLAVLREGVGAIARIDAHRSMWRALGDFFDDERLRQLFGRYATYCGSSPFEAPATLNLIAHVERTGVYLVDGGMYRLVAGLERLAMSLGVCLRCDAPVDRVLLDRGRVVGVALESGEHVRAGAVVMNTDAASLADGRFGTEAARAVRSTDALNRSLSALTWAVVGQATGTALARHNVFFSRDARAEFGDLFDRRALPREPTVYVCAQDRDDAGRSERIGPERYFLIVNAPATGDTSSPSSEEIESCEASTFALLKRCGLTLSPEQIVRTAPADFARSFPSTGGAIYGRVSHGMMSTLARPDARTKVPGLYLAGGSVHPGAGVPMAALSGRIAASSLLRDSRSSASSRRAATPGSISTR